MLLGNFREGYFLRELVWRVSKLYFGGRKVGEIVPDERYSGMCRVVRSDGSLSDMVNRTRVRMPVRLYLRGRLGKNGGGTALQKPLGKI
jgi:hypothetical protein